MTFGDLERSDQGHLLKNTISLRDRVIVTIERLYELIGRGSDGVVSLTFGALERSDQGHLLKNKVSVLDSAIVTIEH